MFYMVNFPSIAQNGDLRPPVMHCTKKSYKTYVMSKMTIEIRQSSVLSYLVIPSPVILRGNDLDHLFHSSRKQELDST